MTGSRFKGETGGQIKIGQLGLNEQLKKNNDPSGCNLIFLVLWYLLIQI